MFFYTNQITDNIKLFIHQLEEAIRSEQQRDMNIIQTKPNTIPEIRPEGLGIKAETPSERMMYNPFFIWLVSNSIEASNEDIIAYHTRSKSRMSNNTSETVDASQTTSNPSLSSTFQANSLQIYHTYCSKRRKTLEGSKDIHYHAEESSHHLYFPDGNQDYGIFSCVCVYSNRTSGTWSFTFLFFCEFFIFWGFNRCFFWYRFQLQSSFQQ